MGKIELYRDDVHKSLRPYFAAMHGAAVRHDKAMLGFVTVDQNALLSWWQDRTSGTQKRKRVIIMLVDDSWVSSGGPEKGEKKGDIDKEADDEEDQGGAAPLMMNGDLLLGYAVIAEPEDETAKHRLTIEELVTSSKHRRKGGGTLLMNGVEKQAREMNKSLLVLDCEKDSPAAKMFASGGYIEAGSIPKCNQAPERGLRDMSIFYKTLV